MIFPSLSVAAWSQGEWTIHDADAKVEKTKNSEEKGMGGRF